MRANKKAIIWTGGITVVSLTICLFQHSNHNLIYDLSLACFGSALLGIVVAYTAYMAERRDAMEQFYEEVRKVIVVLGRIPVIEISELVRGALEYENSWLKENTEKRDELQEYIEVYLPINENTTDEQVREWIDDKYQSMIDDARRTLKNGATAYVAVSEIDLSGLNNSYGRLDFLFGNKSIRKFAYNNLYDKIRIFRLACLNQRIAFKPYLDGRGNEIACLDKIETLQKKFFENRDGVWYAKFRDDLIHDLETFRSQTYGIEPEYEEPYAMNYIIHFDDQRSVERYERHKEKAKNEGRDEQTKRMSVSD